MTDISDTNLAVSRVNPKLIGTVEVTLEAYLGTARLTVADLTALTADSVVPLDARLSQPVELRLGGQAVARGDLVAVDDHYGVRLTEIVRWPD